MLKSARVMPNDVGVIHQTDSMVDLVQRVSPSLIKLCIEKEIWEEHEFHKAVLQPAAV